VARFERWLEVKRIFEAALEVEPQERAAFLDRTCGEDQELRAEVEALLGAPAVPTAALASLLGLPGRQDEPDYGEGDRIDHFAIVRRVGQGGMGVVYEARDTRNNDRPVALKVLFSRAVTLSQDKRLAGLTHPAIVTFHDSGQTSEGLPYFVFEFIEGEPITAFCDRRELALPERLRLFQKVCDPVAYAHQRGVIHCDLKPENILVTATGELKLLDFGIAREVGRSVAPGELSPITLPFASPEQVGNEETTTLSDVYSLGVLLAVLLTGRLPYRRAQTVSELRDAILHDPPSLPSEKVAAAGDGAPRIASAPPAETATKLARQLRGDLDAITLKAIRKEPGERYQSAPDLAADIERHLTDYPVEARGDSRRYRASKFLQRNRGAATVAGLFVLLAFAALGVWFRQYRETVGQRDQARQEATRAEEVSNFLTDLFRVSDPQRQPGGALSARELLDQATRTLQSRLSAQPRTKLRLLNTLGEIYQNLGLFDAAHRCHEDALALAKSRLNSDALLLADTLSDLGTTLAHEGRFPEALANQRQALALRRRALPQNNLDVARSLLGIGATFAAQHSYREAEPVLRDAVRRLRAVAPPVPEVLADALNTLGGMLADDRQLDEAERVTRECLQIRQRIFGPKHPRVAETLVNLASILEIHARFPEAEKLQRQALAIDRQVLGESHPDTLATMTGLGFIQLVAEDLPRATTTFREALQMAHANTEREDPLGVEIRLDLARTLLTAKKVQEGLAVLQEAYEVGVRRLGRNDWLVANIIRAQAEGLMMNHDLSSSEAKFREAIPLFRAKQGEHGYTVIDAEGELGTVLGREGRFAEAEPLLLAQFRQATEREKPDAADRLVLLYEAWGRLDKADEYRKFGTPGLTSLHPKASPSPH
jgi:tetratricopeptide (TPR) repeat protein